MPLFCSYILETQKLHCLHICFLGDHLVTAFGTSQPTNQIHREKFHTPALQDESNAGGAQAEGSQRGPVQHGFRVPPVGGVLSMAMCPYRVSCKTCPCYCQRQQVVSIPRWWRFYLFKAGSKVNLAKVPEQISNDDRTHTKIIWLHRSYW